VEVLTVRTHSRTEFVDITSEVARVVAQSGVAEGICMVFVPHTTAGVTINENADPRGQQRRARQVQHDGLLVHGADSRGPAGPGDLAGHLFL